MNNKDISYLNIPITLNIIIVTSEIFTDIARFYESGLSCLKYYTVLSNLFGTFTSFLSTYYLIQKYYHNTPIPNIITLLKFLSTSCLSLTFIIVIFVLSWSDKEKTLIQFLFCDTGLVFHTVGPVLSFISFIFWEVDYKLQMDYIIYSIIATGLYGFGIIFLVAKDMAFPPYPFLRVKNQTVLETAIWVIVILSIHGLISFGLINLTNLIKDKYPQIMNIKEAKKEKIK